MKKQEKHTVSKWDKGIIATILHYLRPTQIYPVRPTRIKVQFVVKFPSGCTTNKSNTHAHEHDRLLQVWNNINKPIECFLTHGIAAIFYSIFFQCKRNSSMKIPFKDRTKMPNKKWTLNARTHFVNFSTKQLSRSLL